MAIQENLELKIKITNTDGVKGLEQYQKNLKLFRESLRGAVNEANNLSFRKSKKDFELVSARLKLINKEMNQFVKSPDKLNDRKLIALIQRIDTLRNKIETVSKRNEAASRRTEQAEERASRAILRRQEQSRIASERRSRQMETERRNLERLERQHNQAVSRGNQINQRIGKTSIFGGLSDKFNQLGRAVSMVGKYATARFLVSPLIAGFNLLSNAIGSVVTQTINLDTELGKLRAMTKMTDEQVGAIKNTVIDLGSRFGLSADKSAELLLNLSRLGVAGEYLSKVATAAAGLSSAIGGDVNQSAQVLVTTMNAFNISFDKAGETADKMVKTLNSSALDMSEFNTILSYVASSADAVGVSFDKASSMIAVLRNHGLKASQVGTSLRNIFSELVKDGKSIDDVIRKLKDGSMEGLERATMSYGDAVELVGKRSANALKILVEKWDEVAEAKRKAFLDLSTTDAQAMIAGQYSVVEKLKRVWQGIVSKISGTLSGNVSSSDATHQALLEYAGAGVSGATGDVKLMKNQRDILSNRFSEILNSGKVVSRKNLEKETSGSLYESIKAIKENTKAVIASMKKEGHKTKGGIDRIEQSKLEQYISSTKINKLVDAYAEEAIEAATGRLSDAIKKGILKTEKDMVSFKRSALISEFKRVGIATTGQRAKQIEQESKNIQVGQYEHNTRAENQADYNRIKARLKVIDKPRNTAEVEEKEALEKELKSLDDRYNFKPDKNVPDGLKYQSSLSNIESIIGDTSIKKNIESITDRTSILTAEYTEKIKAAPDRESAIKLEDEYLEKVKEYKDAISIDNLKPIIEANDKEIQALLGEIDKDKKAFEVNFKYKFAGNENSVAAKTARQRYDLKASELKEKIGRYKEDELGLIRGGQKGIASQYRTMPDVQRVQKYTPETEYAEKISNSSYDFQEKITGIREAAGRGELSYKQFMMQMKELRAITASNRENVKMRADSNRASIKNEEDMLNMIEELINMNKDVSAYEKDFNANSPQELSTKIQKRKEELNKAKVDVSKEEDSNNKSLNSQDKTVSEGEQGKEGELLSWIGGLSSEAIDTALGIYQSIQDRMLEATLDRIDKEIDAEKRKTDRINSANSGLLELGLISQQEYANNKEKIEIESYDKQNELMEEKFNEEKKAEAKAAKLRLAQRLAEIAINVLLAESKKGLFGVATAPIAIGAFSALAIAQSAAELSAINKKKYVPQKYADGGYVYGNSHANGGVPISVNGDIREMEGGEFIVNKASTAKYRSVLERINNDSVNSSEHYYRENAAIINKLSSIEELSKQKVRAYIVSSDIDKDNRYRVITNSKTKL